MNVGVVHCAHRAARYLDIAAGETYLRYAVSLDQGREATVEEGLKVTVVDNEFATMVYHARYKIVHHTFHKPLAGAAFRAVLMHGLKLFKERGANKWLSDDRGNSALHPDDGKWAMEVWSKQTIDAGWKYWAIVMPDAALGRANMRRFIREYADRGVEVRIFESPEEAFEWLKRPDVATDM